MKYKMKGIDYVFNELGFFFKIYTVYLTVLAV